MSISKSSFLLFLVIAFTSLSYSQWENKYRTIDDTPNGPGYNVPSVAVFGEDKFVALVNSMKNSDTVTCNYLVGYFPADSMTGRLGKYLYGSSNKGIYWKWGTGSDTVSMWAAFKIVASPKDSLVFVANNDINHSILTFKLLKDTVVPAPYRMKTGNVRIWAIDIDEDGKIYVCVDSAAANNTADVMIFESVKNEAKWRTTHDAQPIKTIDLPPSIYKGIAVDSKGKMLFVSDYKNKTVIKYTGSPTTGYTKSTGFNFKMTLRDTITGTLPLNTACPMGLSYMRPFNILLVACDTFFNSNTGFTKGYPYGRVYLVDPSTGNLAGDAVGDPNLNMIDQAKWNYDHTGSWSSQDGVSGYTSTYDCGYDEMGNVYSQSYYGWTVEKWAYFPIMPILTEVKKTDVIPTTYFMSQNYPNPFNPTTQIEFMVPNSVLVTLKVYNMLGQEVATLVNEVKDAGRYIVTFNSRILPTGTYYYKISAGNFTEVKKMMLMK